MRAGGGGGGAPGGTEAPSTLIMKAAELSSLSLQFRLADLKVIIASTITSFYIKKILRNTTQTLNVGIYKIVSV